MKTLKAMLTVSCSKSAAILTICGAFIIACAIFYGGYYTHEATAEQTPPEIITKQIIKQVEIKESYDKVLYVAVYSNGDMEEVKKPGDADQERLEYIVTIEYSSNGYSYSLVELHLLLSNGGEVAFGYQVPGKYKITYEKFKPTKLAPPKEDTSGDEF